LTTLTKDAPHGHSPQFGLRSRSEERTQLPLSTASVTHAHQKNPRKRQPLIHR